MPAAYRFVDRGFVPFPVEDAHDVIGRALRSPRRWGDVFLAIGGDDGPPRPGRRSTIAADGLLPHILRPLFCSKHTWTMKRGEEHIAGYLAERPQ